MITRGIRGAITIEANTEDAIKLGTLELFGSLLLENDIQDTSKISHVIFTLTRDLDAAFPAKFIREELNLNSLAMMCYNELPVKNSLEKCLRILIVLNCDENFEPKFVYLKGASKLRK